MKTTQGLCALACVLGTVGCATSGGQARAAQPLYASTGTCASTELTGATRRLATVYRYGDQYDEYFVRGDAQVGASPAAARAARLSAWDAEEDGDLSRVAVATAVYFVTVPAGTRTLVVDVGYRDARDTLPAGDIADVAGFLFVRNQAVERAAQASESTADRGPLQEPGFFGDTYLLARDQTRALVELPAAERVSDGVVELHLSAGAGQELDVQYVQVTARADPVFVAAPVHTTVETLYIPATYTYTYTYSYYYLGPWYRCHGDRYLAYTTFTDSAHPYRWGGWTTWRACFYTYHPWVYRPAHARHRSAYAGGHARDEHVVGRRRSPDGWRTPGHGEDVHTRRYRDDWYRRAFAADTAQLAEDDVTTRIRERRITVSPPEAEQFRRRAHEVAREAEARIEQVRKAGGDLERRQPQDDKGRSGSPFVAGVRNRDADTPGPSVTAPLQDAAGDVVPPGNKVFPAGDGTPRNRQNASGAGRDAERLAAAEVREQEKAAKESDRAWRKQVEEQQKSLRDQQGRDRQAGPRSADRPSNPEAPVAHAPTAAEHGLPPRGTRWPTSRPATATEEAVPAWPVRAYQPATSPPVDDAAARDVRKAETRAQKDMQKAEKRQEKAEQREGRRAGGLDAEPPLPRRR